jgi:glucose-1-phosphate cytidylyltransferase
MALRVVVLAGGLGTRLSEETERVPKPMVGIGGMPMLWHIMKVYEAADMRHFVVALGYKGEVVKRFFLDYRLMRADLSITTRTGEVEVSGDHHEDWTVDLVDTGLETNTGGRVRRLAKWLPDDLFCLTYGDGLCTVDLVELVAFHRAQGRMATLTAIRPPSRFGGLVLDGPTVADFTEKPQIGEGWINGGFMVLNREVIDRIEGDDASFESDVLEGLAADGQLSAFRHEGFWQSMDTLRDVRTLQTLWDSGDAPWKGWA